MELNHKDMRTEAELRYCGWVVDQPPHILSHIQSVLHNAKVRTTLEFRGARDLMVIPLISMFEVEQLGPLAKQLSINRGADIGIGIGRFLIWDHDIVQFNGDTSYIRIRQCVRPNHLCNQIGEIINGKLFDECGFPPAIHFNPTSQIHHTFNSNSVSLTSSSITKTIEAEPSKKLKELNENLFKIETLKLNYNE